VCFKETQKEAHKEKKSIIERTHTSEYVTRKALKKRVKEKIYIKGTHTSGYARKALATTAQLRCS